MLIARGRARLASAPAAARRRARPTRRPDESCSARFSLRPGRCPRPTSRPASGGTGSTPGSTGISSRPTAARPGRLVGTRPALSDSVRDLEVRARARPSAPARSSARVRFDPLRREEGAELVELHVGPRRGARSAPGSTAGALIEIPGPEGPRSRGRRGPPSRAARGLGRAGGLRPRRGTRRPRSAGPSPRRALVVDTPTGTPIRDTSSAQAREDRLAAPLRRDSRISRRDPAQGQDARRRV